MRLYTGRINWSQSRLLDVSILRLFFCVDKYTSKRIKETIISLCIKRHEKNTEVVDEVQDFIMVEEK